MEIPLSPEAVVAVLEIERLTRLYGTGEVEHTPPAFHLRRLAANSAATEPCGVEVIRFSERLDLRSHMTEASAAVLKHC